MLKKNTLLTIQKLIKERYAQAQAVFWAGSVSVDQGLGLMRRHHQDC